MGKKKRSKIIKFIKNNKLNFTDSGSSLNSNYMIISGYACWLEMTENDLIKSFAGELDSHVEAELRRIFKYCESRDYGAWWNKADAKFAYKF